MTDPRDGKRVALKKMPNVFQNLVSCKRVFRELKMLCFFKHENVSTQQFYKHNWCCMYRNICGENGLICKCKASEIRHVQIQIPFLGILKKWLTLSSGALCFGHTSTSTHWLLWGNVSFIMYLFKDRLRHSCTVKYWWMPHVPQYSCPGPSAKHGRNLCRGLIWIFIDQADAEL